MHQNDIIVHREQTQWKQDFYLSFPEITSHVQLEMEEMNSGDDWKSRPRLGGWAITN